MSPSRTEPPTTHVSLLGRVHARCRVAWEAFFLRYDPVIRNWCARHQLPAEVCNDLAQDLILNLPRKIAAYHRQADDGGTNRFRSWLRAVVRNAAADYARARDRRPGDFGIGGDENAVHDLATDELESELAASHRRDVNEVVDAVRAKLGPDTWDIYEQVRLRGDAPAEVAERFGKSAAAVYMAVHRVNGMLQAEYQRVLQLNGDVGGNADAELCNEEDPLRLLEPDPA